MTASSNFRRLCPIWPEFPSLGLCSRIEIRGNVAPGRGENNRLYVALSIGIFVGDPYGVRTDCVLRIYPSVVRSP
jgi:hypothetical protein